MARHGALRARPAELMPGTLRVISCRMDYLSDVPGSVERRDHANMPTSRAMPAGRDYHKVLRGRLQKLCERIEAEAGPFGYRVFTDSAPVLEVELAARAGIGWRGKHTLLLDRDAGSLFFLGEIYCDLPLPPDRRRSAESLRHLQRCIDVCPTQAIRGPYQLDARRCISYLTIEHKSAIPEELRPLIGNRVYGCDDCQLVCPWNKFAQPSARGGLRAAQRPRPRHAGRAVRLDRGRVRRSACRARRSAASATSAGCATSPSAWAMRRLRGDVIEALRARADHPSALVREHVRWALLTA